MKNNRIVRAYDSINPSPADKAKMLDAILAEANLTEELPKPKEEKKETVLFTGRPTKSSRRSILGGLAACLAVFVIGGAVLLQLGNAPEGPAYVDPTETASYDRSAQDHYAPVLEKYRHAAAEGWTKEQCEIEGISLRMQAGNDFTKLGYAFLDLDGDGREELLIAEEAVPHIDHVWDLYTTLEDGTPIQLWVDECDGNQCYLYEDNIIGTEYTAKTEAEYVFYTLEAGQLVMQESLQYEDEDTVLHTDAEGKTRSVTSKEAMDISYSYDHKKLDLIWLADIPDYLRDIDSVEGYTQVLEKYHTAMMENWTKDQCYENDISAQIVYDNTVSRNLSWCLLDIDENGTEELIISNGETLIDLYSIKPDDIPGEKMIKSHGKMEYVLPVQNGICHLAKSEGAVQYSLMEDGTVVYHIAFEKGISWCFYKVKPWGLELQDVLLYRFDDGGYHYGPDEEQVQPISKDEAGEILMRIRNMKLSSTYFAEEKQALANRYSYESLLEIYKTALSEQWDIDQCRDMDICYLIAWLQDTPEDLGACYMDLNEDGEDELLIVNGNTIYDLYTMKEGRPLHVLSGAERSHYALWPDNSIVNNGSGSAFWSVFNRYVLQQGELVLIESVISDYQTDPAQPCFRSPDGVTLGDPLTQQEADAIRNAYSPITFSAKSILEWK